MWTARLSRRDVLELLLSARLPSPNSLKKTTGVIFSDDTATFHAFWEKDLTAALPMPDLLVVPNGAERELLVALNASPHSPSPVTSLTRVLTRSEALALFDSSTLDGGSDLLPATVALALVEAVVLSEGRVPLRQVTPAICKRTLSYAWGKALAARSPASFIEKLPSRWLESYEMVNGSAAYSWPKIAAKELVAPLGICAQLGLGLQPETAAGKLAYACFRRDPTLRESAWSDLAKWEGGAPPLGSIASATREDRGGYLQQLLRAAAPSDNDDSMAATCAFLATQIAPGSLEHFDLLGGASNPSVAYWYALYACLQTPTEILAGMGGLGLRVLRDVSKTEEQFGRPTADIAYSELKALERVGIDALGRKFGHLGEVEVELVPLVTSSFSFLSRSSRIRNDATVQLPLEHEAPSARREQSTKSRMRLAIAMMSDILRELPDAESSEQSAAKRGNQTTGRRSKTTRNGE
jgi:hypothetical protein